MQILSRRYVISIGPSGGWFSFNLLCLTITWTNGDLPNAPLGTSVNKRIIKIHQTSFNKIYLNKWSYKSVQISCYSHGYIATHLLYQQLFHLALHDPTLQVDECYIISPPSKTCVRYSLTWATILERRSSERQPNSLGCNICNAFIRMLGTISGGDGILENIIDKIKRHVCLLFFTRNRAGKDVKSRQSII